MKITIHHVDGTEIETREFAGEPQKDDTLLVGDRLYQVYSRRWEQDGRLALIVTPYSLTY